MDQLLHIKSELALRGLKIKDLATALNWDYAKLSRVINGYQDITPDFDQQVRRIFEAWDAENERVLV